MDVVLPFGPEHLVPPSPFGIQVVDWAMTGPLAKRVDARATERKKRIAPSLVVNPTSNTDPENPIVKLAPA